jgi:hypothetical protein
MVNALDALFLVSFLGGLATPLVAAGLGTLLSGIGLGGTVAAGYLGAMAASAPLVGGLFGAYGGRLTGEMMNRYSKEVSVCSFSSTKRRLTQTAGQRFRLPPPQP